MRKFLEFLRKCQKSDPEIILLNPQGQGELPGEENTVFSVTYFKNEWARLARGGVDGSTGGRSIMGLLFELGDETFAAVGNR